MSIYRIVLTASVGAAYVEADSPEHAAEALDFTRPYVDTADVKYDEWRPELLDLSKDDLEKLDPVEEQEARERFFDDGSSTDEA